MSIPTAIDFKTEIEKIKMKAVEIISGNLHRQLGGYPGKSHRMASCCQAMYMMLDSTDEYWLGHLEEKGHV